MYELSVLAIFKNESMIIREWICHCLSEGVEHFYLIDNGSTDDYMTKISDYMQYITLVIDSRKINKPKNIFDRIMSNYKCGKFLHDYGTQTYLYNDIFIDTIKKETKWIMICDIDEYIYARNGYKTIPDVLNSLPSHIDKVLVYWKFFGSNNLEKQPENIVKSFTKKCSNLPHRKFTGKCISKTQNIVEFYHSGHDIILSNNNILYSLDGKKIENWREILSEEYIPLDLHLNHYVFMSEEYFTNTKIVRGGGDTGFTSGRYNLEYFHEKNKLYNEIEDKELCFKKYESEI